MNGWVITGIVVGGLVVAGVAGVVWLWATAMADWGKDNTEDKDNPK